MMRSYIPLTFLLLILTASWGQDSTENPSILKSDQQIKSMISEYRQLIRGPYLKIQWFCEDSTKRDAKDPCPKGVDGIQHAEYRPQVVQLGKTNHVFLGDILAYTEPRKFWDQANNHSRMKQYQLQNYLEAVDNGWVQEKSQFYRGAVQIEDESEWGRDFFTTYLASDALVDQDFFMLREALKDIPHGSGNNVAQEMRSQSKVLGDKHSSFMDIRTKIHNNPERSDIRLVQEWQKENADQLKNEEYQAFDELVETMQEFYQPIELNALGTMVSAWPADSYLISQIDYLEKNYAGKAPKFLVPAAASLMCDIRAELTRFNSGELRLQAMDLSLALENLVFRQAAEWEPQTLQEHLDKIYALSTASASSGYLENWEWEKVEDQLFPAYSYKVPVKQLLDYLSLARKQVAWGSGMFYAVYNDVIDLYDGFEPKSHGFLDDRIRSSVLLPLGEAVNDLGNLMASQTEMSNTIVGLEDTGNIRGLNAGYAKGQLRVISGPVEELEVDKNNIYIFERPPSDLKPVAGIATVAEGNLVSHVQLLARNLGIPNAALDSESLTKLKQYDGQEMFYAVSPSGTVLLKAAADMTEEEKNLFNKESRVRNMIRIPENEIRLDVNQILDMNEVSSSDSGKLCGPKAANLGELKNMFPDHVVNGLVVPFGVFREHMNQQMPSRTDSYWEYLMETFAKAKTIRKTDSSESATTYQLARFDTLRSAIKDMALDRELVRNLRSGFQTTLGGRMGTVPVFLRSDTNMEDLEEFTGAGLNLTVFNVASEEKILQGIRDVWASPYTERSFRWRQDYLENPESVYPSILIIPTVSVDFSGVLITDDVTGDESDALTIAMSRGAGGAVDGQSAESYLVTRDGSRSLLAPAREPKVRKLPTTGGSVFETATFERPILQDSEVEKIIAFAKAVKQKMPDRYGSTEREAWDVELGFKDGKLYLFQIRPFVENANAKTSAYLQSITPKIDMGRELLLHKDIYP